MADNENHDELITQFVDLTGASPSDARQYLAANRWDLSGAAAEYFTALEEGTAEAQGEDENEAPEEPYTGPRTLDGRPAPQSIPTVASSSAAPKKKGGIATLGSLNQGPTGAHAGHGHDDDDSDDEDFDPEEEPRDLFAGGEKSGLAVQDPSSNRNDPRKVVKDILKKAAANDPGRNRGGESSSSAPPTRFRGSGQTLGGDDTPSQVIPDPRAGAPETAPVQRRILHLWEDGFSVEDGPLRRFDDPQHAQDLQMIRSGRAPLHLMGVREDQPVDVQLIKHDDAYKAPPKVYKPFSGSGNRLGSPTPGGPSSPAAPATASPSTTTPSGSQTNALEPVIDPSQPTLSLRIQLANGTRLTVRFNTTSTIGDVQEFIKQADPASAARGWVLATTFPNKDHTDSNLVLGEMSEFKRGGTAVQKMI
ncbi:hypothetical protein VTL71DRAFT_1952 [Oculimacula yallundae]|uniref:Uncharacterized protein n=1 Tax=Oculimacula yallundae TaxID=86028 RepID=A0ABR4CCX9_9HELO